MKYSFTCRGHENITAKHKTTLEFTKDKDMGLEGDCIIGIKAYFSLLQLKKFIKKLNNNKITIIIEMINNINKNIKNKKNNYNNKIVEKINAEINRDFNSDKEIVIRKSNFKDKRTFAIKADKAACDLDRDLIKNIIDNKQRIKIVFD